MSLQKVCIKVDSPIIHERQPWRSFHYALIFMQNRFLYQKSWVCELERSDQSIKKEKLNLLWNCTKCRPSLYYACSHFTYMLNLGYSLRCIWIWIKIVIILSIQNISEIIWKHHPHKTLLMLTIENMKCNNVPRLHFIFDDWSTLNWFLVF